MDLARLLDEVDKNGLYFPSIWDIQEHVASAMAKTIQQELDDEFIKRIIAEAKLKRAGVKHSIRRPRKKC